MVAVMKGHRFMKIVSVIISAIAFLFSLSGCSGYPHSSWLEDDSLDKIAEKRCEDIVAALENKDSSAIKAMFSQKAIEEAEDLDDEIEYIIEHYEGSLKSFKGTTSTEENINGKSKKTTVKADYTVITDKQTYVLFFVEVSNTDDETENGIYRLWLSNILFFVEKLNSENAEEEGLYLFQLAKESDVEKVQGKLDAGIYIPEE